MPLIYLELPVIGCLKKQLTKAILHYIIMLNVMLT
jgi:hypothetical protein